MTQTIVERFWKKVDKTSYCWEWTAYKLKKGLPYGVFGCGNRIIKYAHRYSYELHFGKIPMGLKVLHKCDNAKCVRPDHLFLGTQADNIRDMDTKSRRHCKLDKYKVARIRLMKQVTPKFPQNKICKIFSVDQSTISDIFSGKHWPSIIL